MMPKTSLAAAVILLGVAGISSCESSDNGGTEPLAAGSGGGPDSGSMGGRGGHAGYAGNTGGGAGTGGAAGHVGYGGSSGAGGTGGTGGSGGGASGWANQMVLTIDHAVLSKTAPATGNPVNPTVGALTNFPLMIHLGPSSGKTSVDTSHVFTVLGSNSKKISITASDQTTQCHTEVVRWDTEHHEAYLWVNVPSVSYSEDTVLYLHYDPLKADNDAYVGVTRSAAAEAVWDSDFAGVWHLAESGNGTVGEFRDSTSNHHDGQGGGSLVHEGAPTGIAPSLVVGGTTGYAQHFQNGRWITVPTTNGDWSVFSHLTTGVTITHFATADNIAWPTTNSTCDGLQTVQFGNSVDGYQWEIWPCSANSSQRPQYIDAYIFGLTGSLGDGGAARPGVAGYVGPQYANNEPTFFGDLFDTQYTAYAIWNGVVYRGGTDPGGFLPGSPYPVNFVLEGGLGDTLAPLCFGTSYNRQDYSWTGNLSEIHVSKIARSDSWIAAEFYSGMDRMVTFSGP
jgi:hypothetical protein